MLADRATTTVCVLAPQHTASPRQAESTANPGPLPEGWVSRVNPTTNQPYYKAVAGPRKGEATYEFPRLPHTPVE